MSDAPRQILFAFHVPAVVVPQPDGAVLIKPGKPVERLTPAEFAKRVGLSTDSIYRYIDTDAIPARFVEWSGKRRIYIRADAIEWFLGQSKAARRGETMPHEKGRQDPFHFPFQKP